MTLSTSALILAYQYYRVNERDPAREARQAEVDQCLFNNIMFGFFAEIHLLLESQEDCDAALGVLGRVRAAFAVDDNGGEEGAGTKEDLTERVFISLLGRRFRFSDGFSVTPRHSVDKAIIVVVNGDIYFENVGTLASLGERQFAAISRWESLNGGDACLVNGPENTQDTWACRYPVCPSLVATLSFPQGHWHCENRIVFEAHKAGYTLCNPCDSVKTIHLHKDEYRTIGYHSSIYTAGPYGAVVMSSIDGPDAYKDAGWYRTDTQTPCFCTSCNGGLAGR